MTGGEGAFQRKGRPIWMTSSGQSAELKEHQGQCGRENLEAKLKGRARPGCAWSSRLPNLQSPQQSKKVPFTATLRPAILRGVFFPPFFYRWAFLVYGHFIIFSKTLFEKCVRAHNKIIRFKVHIKFISQHSPNSQSPCASQHISSILGLKVWEKFPVSVKPICSCETNCVYSIQLMFWKLPLGVLNPALFWPMKCKVWVGVLDSWSLEFTRSIPFLLLWVMSRTGLPVCVSPLGSHSNLG